MIELYRSEYYEILEDPRRKLVFLRRSDLPYPDADAVRVENVRVLSFFDERHADWGVVVDMRAAQPNNSRGFEEAMKRFRAAIGRWFARVVVLVQSASGTMQVSRLHREDGSTYHVTRDEDDAVRLAMG